jgi:hypothetical protein
MMTVSRATKNILRANPTKLSSVWRFGALDLRVFDIVFAVVADRIGIR